MALEPIILILAVLAVIVVYYVLKTAKLLIVNTILGLILLFVSNMVFKIGINVSDPIVILVCALGGIPGALLVILLHVFRIAF